LKSIQGILIAFLFAAAIVASFAFKAKLAYRLLAVLLLTAATVLVIFPDLTTQLAHRLGVGRGTDLLLYVSLIAGLHVALLLYLRTRELERKITELARAFALRNAGNAGSAGNQ
jgi:small membrane protein